MSFSDEPVDFGTVAGGLGLQGNFRPISGPFLQELQSLLPAIRPPKVSILPSAPGAGSEVYYAADASTGVYWHLAYMPDGTSNPWKYVGGPELYNLVTTQETTASNTYADLTTVGPSVTIPVNGDYRVAFGVDIEGSAQDRAFVAPKIGSTTPVDTNAVTQAVGNPAAQSQGASGSRVLLLFGLTAGTVLKLQYHVTVASTMSFSNRWIETRPLGVGS